MEIVCYVQESGGYRGKHLAGAMGVGFKRHGHHVVSRDRFRGVEGGIAVAYGWRHHEIFEAYKAAGAHYLYLDLGYWLRKPIGKRWEGYHKVALDAWCPSEKMRRGCPSDRFDRLNIPILDGKHPGDAIVVAGMSAKSAAHHGFKYEEWERAAINELQGCGREIVYRPKGSKTDRPRAIDGSSFNAGGEFSTVLHTAFAVATHHSNCAIDALAAGRPVYCEKGIGALASSPTLKELLNARPQSRRDRRDLLADVAYSQWTPDEMRRGVCWDHYRELIR